MPGAVLRDHRGEDAEHKATGIHQRQVGESADSSRAERLHHQQREQRRIETDARTEQNTAERGRTQPQRPRGHADPHGVGAAEPNQRRVVDDRLHRQPGTRPAEEHKQCGGDESRGHQRADDRQGNDPPATFSRHTDSTA